MDDYTLTLSILISTPNSFTLDHSQLQLLHPHILSLHEVAIQTVLGWRTWRHPLAPPP